MGIKKFGGFLFTSHLHRDTIGKECNAEREAWLAQTPSLR